MSRNRDLKPDAQGRYRPYLGWKADITFEDNQTPRYSNRRQHRFNLGTDKREAEKRLARLRELWDENCQAFGEELWTQHALSYAERIARGEYRIEVPPLSEADGYDEPPPGIMRSFSWSGTRTRPSTSCQPTWYSTRRRRR